MAKRPPSPNSPSSLPPRPNLDHLRGQAKKLLHSLTAGDAEAVSTFREFLPAARGMSPAKIRAAGFRLADAQSAIARKSGFDAWPLLARHVEQLRALEGTWSFLRLEVDGAPVPAAAVKSARLLIDGDRFRSESPEATYEGVFNINVEAQPHHIDIEFVEGPEAGNWNHGIFRIGGEGREGGTDHNELEICLDMSGKSRPTEFRTTPGSQHACETLRRTSGERPESVTGGKRGAAAPPTHNAAEPVDVAAFQYIPSPTLTRLQGDWTATRLNKAGQEMPSHILPMGRRVAKDNEVTVTFGGKVMVHALVRIREGTNEIDYCNIGGMAQGSIQLGIMEWRSDEVCFCMAAPGDPRPTSFEPGEGRTLSCWRAKK